MARRKSEFDPNKRDLYVVATALHTSHGYTQKQIAAHLGISQPHVSNLLKTAKARKYLGEHPPFNPEAEGLTEEIINQAKSLFVSDEPLAEKLKKLQKRPVAFGLAVFPSGREEFARGAAHYVAELLGQSGRLIGVGYGRTLERLVKEIGVATRGDRRRFADQLCVPVSGSPLNLLNQREEIYTSSLLSTQLQKSLTGKALSNLPSLTGVPAYIARRYSLEDDRAGPDGHVGRDISLQNGEHLKLKEVGRLAPGYRQIFGGDENDTSPPFVQRIDTLLTGLGIVAPRDDINGPFTTGAFIRERIEAEQSADVTVEALRPLIHGDLGGVLVRRDHIREGSDGWRLIEDLNRGWIGFRMQHLVQIAARAKKGGPPGVIVATVVHPSSEALIAARAAMIKEITAQGLVNHLIISKDIADALRSDLS